MRTALLYRGHWRMRGCHEAIRVVVEPAQGVQLDTIAHSISGQLWRALSKRPAHQQQHCRVRC
jgi:hypothetical protein